jgi:hypothetical protein
VVEVRDQLWVGDVFGCDVEGVEVASGGLTELNRRMVLLSSQTGR